MQTGPARGVRISRSLAAGWALFVLLAACGPSSSASPSPKPSASSPIPFTPRPTPTPVPEQMPEPSLPAAVEETAAAAAGGSLYVMGGFNAAGASLSSVYVFDGSAWRSGPRLPVALDHSSAATLGDKVYVAGGHSFGADSRRVFRLDGDHWTELASMRYARGGHALLAAQGRLYAIGGNTAAGNVGAVESYDPAANAWTVVATMPDPRNHVLGFVMGSSVCVAGGRSPTTARVDCLDTAHDAWSRLAGLPQATSGGGALAFAGGSVVAMGGQDAAETAIVNVLTRYSGGGWSAPEQMLVPRHGFELALFEGRAWACGGGTAPGLHPVAACTSVGPPPGPPRGK